MNSNQLKASVKTVPAPVVVPPPTHTLVIEGLSRKDLRLLRGIFGGTVIKDWHAFRTICDALNEAVPGHEFKQYHHIKNGDIVLPSLDSVPD